MNLKMSSFLNLVGYEKKIEITFSRRYLKFIFITRPDLFSKYTKISYVYNYIHTQQPEY